MTMYFYALKYLISHTVILFLKASDIELHHKIYLIIIIIIYCCL